jgi:hypothetical protein
MLIIGADFTGSGLAAADFGGEGVLAFEVFVEEEVASDDKG